MKIKTYRTMLHWIPFNLPLEARLEPLSKVAIKEEEEVRSVCEIIVGVT